MKKSLFNSLRSDSAVSPVVGIMLMLVVTIIIAAVVTGFAGGIAGSTQQAPTIAATTSLELTGEKDSRLFIRVDSVSQPIPSKDLKIITSWSKNVDGAMVYGGGTSIAGKTTPAYLTSGGETVNEVAPIGFGPGVDVWASYGTRKIEQHFGNYSVESGTTMLASPYRARPSATGGYGPRFDTSDESITGVLYEYHNGTRYNIGENFDVMQSVLGSNWNVLRPGDIVSVKIVHIPSDKVIYERDIAATGRSFL
jgi:FlaG/FlaF family flagellin (archaellin)